MANSDRKILIAKEEETESTDSSPSASTDACQVIGLEVMTEADEVEREIAVPYLGAKPFILTKRLVKFKFDIEVAGSGTAGQVPAWGRYLKACGWSETILTTPAPSVVYVPVNDGFTSLTMKGNFDGIQYVGLGCRGKVSANFKSSEISKFSFEFQGFHIDPTDVALPTPTFANQSVPIHFAAGNVTDFAFDSYQFCLDEVSWDSNNNLVPLERVGCARRNLITERAIEGDITVERTQTLAMKNLYPKVGSHQTVPLVFTLGNASGNKVKFEMPTLQLKYPEMSDQDKILMQKYAFKAIPVGGASEMVITAF